MMSTSNQLIDRLHEELNYPLLTSNTLHDFLLDNEYSVLFFTEDASRFAESNDVAIVLPELATVFPQMKPAVIARDDEKKLQSVYGFTSWPALVFMRRDNYLNTITGIQDWSYYLTEINQILSSESRRPRSIGIPVVSH